MKIIIAPDKLKGTLSSFAFCKAAKEGILSVFPQADILEFPLTDGGEGMVDILQHYLQGTLVETTVNDPLFRKIKATYGISKDHQTAYIEMASASGLYLLKNEVRNCNYTTTFGTGEQILHAMGQGVRKIILGLGGSATQDAGIGMAAALGYRFLSENGKELQPIGKNLLQIKTIDDSQVSFDKNAIDVKVACDVSNPLYGKDGSAFVYAKQKGATREDIIALDRGLQNFAKCVNETYQDLDISRVEGGGAAGGLGAGSVVFLGANLVPGTDLLLEVSGIKRHIQESDLVITGEGCLDEQTFYGKVVSGISKLCKNKVPLVGIFGNSDLSKRMEKSLGLDSVYQIIQVADNKQDAFENASRYVKHIAGKIANKNFLQN